MGLEKQPDGDRLEEGHALFLDQRLASWTVFYLVLFRVVLSHHALFSFLFVLPGRHVLSAFPAMGGGCGVILQ